jgi:hypothetical protein
MKGAKQYSHLFRDFEVVGKLLIWPGSHARGKTLDIWVLPPDSIVHGRRAPEDAVKVYGPVSGQPGWAESYGWIHRGPWVDDFENLVKSRQEEYEDRAVKNKDFSQQKAKEKEDRELKVLSSY